jgi:hypothetical protein
MKPLFDFLSEQREDKKFYQTAMACNGIHVALSIILTVALVAFGILDSLPYIVLPFMLLGWIPLRIWLCPILLKRMK